MNTAATKSGRGWVLAQSILLLALVASGPLGRAADAWLSGTATVLGGVLFAIGTFFGVAGVRHLGRNRTPYPEPLADAALVTTGVYAVVRHPLYASLLYAGFGWALIWNSAATLVIAVLAVCFFTAKAQTEERHLQTRFPAYADYARRVKRFLPGIW